MSTVCSTCGITGGHDGNCPWVTLRMSAMQHPSLYQQEKGAKHGYSAVSGAVSHASDFSASSGSYFYGNTNVQDALHLTLASGSVVIPDQSMAAGRGYSLLYPWSGPVGEGTYRGITTAYDFVRVVKPDTPDETHGYPDTIRYYDSFTCTNCGMSFAGTRYCTSCGTRAL